MHKFTVVCNQNCPPCMETQVSFILHGAPVSRGIAIGRACLIAPATLEVNRYRISSSQIEAEIARFHAAQDQVRRELEALRAELPADAPAEMNAFLNVHALLLHDATLTEAILTLIRARRYNAEWALAEQLEKFGHYFDDIENEYLRERKADFQQVVEQLLKALAKTPASIAAYTHSGHSPVDSKIVIAHDISPADMLQFRTRATQTFCGFITERGGSTSHTAIVARSLGIPAVLGAPLASVLIRQDDLIIVDGNEGVVMVQPSPRVLEEYVYQRRRYLRRQISLSGLLSAPACTADGIQVNLYANIELPEDARAALEAGACGIGLFRTEFLWMRPHGQAPEEEAQFEAYRHVVETMNGRPVTIRTFDAGADKMPDGYAHSSTEYAPNPALGLRAIRWSLAEPRILLAQLRAILRAARFGPVRILIPMLTHAQQIGQTFELIQAARRQCMEAGLNIEPDLQIGAMIEVPASALMAPFFAKHFDFLSMGTNDLIQYTLAIDRCDKAVAHLYDPLHPAVLRLIAETLRSGHQAGIPVSVCGEMAGDPAFTRVLLGLGLTEFSMPASQLLIIKQHIRQLKQCALKSAVRGLLAAHEPKARQAALQRLSQV